MRILNCFEKIRVQAENALYSAYFDNAIYNRQR